MTRETVLLEKEHVEYKKTKWRLSSKIDKVRAMYKDSAVIITLIIRYGFH